MYQLQGWINLKWKTRVLRTIDSDLHEQIEIETSKTLKSIKILEILFLWDDIYRVYLYRIYSYTIIYS